MSFFFRNSIRLVRCSNRSFHKLAADNVKNSKNYKIENFKVNQLRHLVEADLIINEKFKNNKKIDENEWSLVRENLLSHNFVTETSVDSKIFDICSYFNKPDEAVNYFNYLKCHNYNLNLNTIREYFKIFFYRNTPLSSAEEKEILEVYDDLRKNYPLLDQSTCNSCICVLSLTKRWKESLELLEMLRISCRPGVHVTRAIISAAFQNNEPDLAWKMMHESIVYQPLDHKVYDLYVDYCTKNNDLVEGINKMFNFWKEYRIEPTKFIIEKYAEVYEQFGYKSSFTTVSKQGVCHNCQATLNKLSLSKQDFENLSKSILKNIIVGENVYRSTSPQELKRYMLFVQTMKPYDVVIDGLNVAYSGRKAGQPGSLQNLISVVEFFEKNKKRILVIGKVHMNWWSKEIMATLRKKADVFLTKNISQDDPFLLHIALMSGAQTYFVSRDLMRQHKFKLDENLKKLFKQWQLSRQYFFKNENNQQVTLIPPAPFDKSAQSDPNGWHIPYVLRTDLRVEESYAIPKNWVCFRKLSDQKCY